MDGPLHRGETHALSTCSRSRAPTSSPPRSRSTASIRSPAAAGLPERDALTRLFRDVRRRSGNDCKRAILVGHNASFDLGLPECRGGRAPASSATRSTRSRAFDTVTLAGVALGQTVLAKAAMDGGPRFGFRLGALGRSTTRSARQSCSASSATACLGIYDEAAEAPTHGLARWTGATNAPPIRPRRPPAETPASEPTQAFAVAPASSISFLSSPFCIISSDDVAAADQFALHVELRIGRPVRVALQRFAQLRVLEDVHVR
jgi:hypothetical protein